MPPSSPVDNTPLDLEGIGLQAGPEGNHLDRVLLGLGQRSAMGVCARLADHVCEPETSILRVWPYGHFVVALARHATSLSAGDGHLLRCGWGGGEAGGLGGFDHALPDGVAVDVVLARQLA